MVRGQYIAATGMMLQRRQMETVTNNITNVETSGYKKNFLVSRTFDDVMIERLNDPAVLGQTRMVGPMALGTRVDQIFTDFGTGIFEETQRTTDLALVGDGFFVVETPAGERYTRSGSFTINIDGYLTDHDGNYVLGSNGRIYVGSSEFAIDGRGNVMVDGQITNTVRVVAFEDNAELRKQGDSLYYSMGALPAQALQIEIRQGFLEGSNVDVAREMVDMITLYRAYETNQKMLTMIDETVGKAVNDIGRLR